MRLNLIHASRVGFNFLLPSIALGLLPASCSGSLSDGLSIGQNAPEPFGAAAAPSLRVVSTIAIGGMTSVDVEHGANLRTKRLTVNSGGGTRLVQFTYTACKYLTLKGIKWWPETASSALTRAEARNGGGGQGMDRVPLRQLSSSEKTPETAGAADLRA